GGGAAGGAADLASRAAARLRELAALDDRLEPLAGTVQSAAYELEEAARQLRLYAEGLDLEPGELDQVEERLAVLGRLCRKYGADEAAVLAYRQRAAAELDQLSRADAMAAALEGELEVRRRRAEEACDRLTALRRQAALQLEAAMAAELPALGLSGAAFAAAVEAVDNGFSAGGRDRVRFLVSMNRGEPLQPLQRVASGGELARVMLGLGNVLAGVDPVATIVFDEVESGLGGQAAVAVAERLVRLARHHQVLCVSHLPQVAARCRHHLLAEKEETGGRIRTRFRVLTGEERVAELARMLSGDAEPLALEHARQLLRQAASH
ncbi:MAG: DNA repair protein RecN, partial [Clostridia bacterium]|nr:DNA repair protein RecN [Clostridia bacterium]